MGSKLHRRREKKGFNTNGGVRETDATLGWGCHQTTLEIKHNSTHPFKINNIATPLESINNVSKRDERMSDRGYITTDLSV